LVGSQGVAGGVVLPENVVNHKEGTDVGAVDAHQTKGEIDERNGTGARDPTIEEVFRVSLQDKEARDSPQLNRDETGDHLGEGGRYGEGLGRMRFVGPATPEEEAKGEVHATKSVVRGSVHFGRNRDGSRR
jgi:hypothetical protein